MVSFCHVKGVCNKHGFKVIEEIEGVIEAFKGEEKLFYCTEELPDYVRLEKNFTKLDTRIRIEFLRAFASDFKIVKRA